MKMNELMIYQVFPLRALTDGQPSHGILEMSDWIPHIKKLGMNAVYFSPVFSSSDHGYDTKDYQLIDERLGTNEDLKKYVKECHKQGIRVIFDGVFNHTGRDFFAFKDIQKNRDNSQYKNWYCNVNFCTISGERFIDRVINNLINQMIQSFSRDTSDIHTRALTHCFETFQHGNTAGIIRFFFWHNCSILTYVLLSFSLKNTSVCPILGAQYFIISFFFPE